MNPFVVLGVPHDVDDAGLKRAYFKKLREHPPETDAEEFQKVQQAFDTLRDPAKRHAAAKRFAEAVAALDAARSSRDTRDVSDAQLEGARLLTRMEQGEQLDLGAATAELAPTLVSLAATMIDTQRHVYARTLLDKVQALQPERPPIPFGPSKLIPVDQLPPGTREAVAHNASSPSNMTVRIARPPKTKSWVLKPVWWVELRPLHVIVRRANGVQVCPLLSMHLQQREHDVPLMLCDGADAGLSGMPELAFFFEAVMGRKRRLLDLMSKDLIETEQSLEPLQWTPSSNA